MYTMVRCWQWNTTAAAFQYTLVSFWWDYNLHLILTKFNLDVWCHNLQWEEEPKAQSQNGQMVQMVLRTHMYCFKPVRQSNLLRGLSWIPCFFFFMAAADFSCILGWLIPGPDQYSCSPSSHSGSLYPSSLLVLFVLKLEGRETWTLKLVNFHSWKTLALD